MAEFSGNDGNKMLTDILSLLQKISNEYTKINAAAKDITKSTKDQASALGGGAGGGPGSVSQSSGSFSGGFNKVGQVIGAVGNLAMGLAGAAATAMPTVQTALQTQLLTSQARFSGMQGNIPGTVKSLMGQGTTNSPMDVAQAIAQGTSAGLNPGLTGYKNIMTGVMNVSNLTGSAQSAMQATTSLNSASSVNTMRMLGINVRGSNGAMRSPSDIFKEIFNFAVAQSGGRLNASNIAIALQPGNGLANMLDAASAGDPVLRDALQRAAMQFAQGGNLSKSSLTKTGQLTEAVNSQSAMNASQYGLNSAASGKMAEGYVEANTLLVKATDKLADLVITNQQVAFALKQLAKGETLAGSPVGQATIGAVSSIVGFVKNIVGIATGGGGDTGNFMFGGDSINAGGGKVGGGAAVNPQVKSPTSTAAGSAVASIASTALGIPYSWGGGNLQGPTTGIAQGKNTNGFDCSSLVRYVMARMGVVLPRTAHEQQKCGVQIDPKQAQAGDLLFWGNPAHHVGIYIGGGMMIQAPQTGGHVEKVNVNLAGVDTASRVINGTTGTTQTSNLLDGGKAGAPGTSGTSSFNSVIEDMFGNTMSGSLLNQVSTSDLRGYSAESAMGGGGVGGSGLGFGAAAGSSGMNASTGSSNSGSAQQYLQINHSTGKLDTSSPTSVGGTTVNYGGVTVKVDVPQGAKIDAKELAKMIKTELTSLNIKSGVATK